MPKQVKQHNTGYPVEEWVQKALKMKPGYGLQLVKGKDYQCSCVTMQQYIWRVKREQNLKITCRRNEDGILLQKA